MAILSCLATAAIFLFFSILGVRGGTLHGPGGSTLQQRQASSSPLGPVAGWLQLPGCYTDDNAASRTLLGPSFTDTAVSPLECTAFCDNLGVFGFAGIEFARVCNFEDNCGSVIRPGLGNLTDSSECNLPCEGDPSLTCGGPSRLTIFNRPGRNGPQIRENAFTWNYIGCFSCRDGPNRTLSARLNPDEPLPTDEPDLNSGKNAGVEIQLKITPRSSQTIPAAHYHVTAMISRPALIVAIMDPVLPSVSSNFRIR
ncbi:hypothetical protein BDZ97DRAFT_1755076 [Flammula alnicola]|nr:hypothetical protein BDZ97DRAFT_1755076 [Flammula alnicola]